MPLQFTKLQGLGNDFVLIDHLGIPRTSFTSEQARRICDRRFGIGADQILWLKTPKDETADARMEIINADGSIAEMCGNGIRAVAVYLAAKEAGGAAALEADGDKAGPARPEPKRKFRIETMAGIKAVEILPSGLVQVDMGPPTLGRGLASKAGERLLVEGEKVTFYEVGLGNPHAVIFTEKDPNEEVDRLGPGIEHDPRFPNRTNVEFVQFGADLPPGEIRVRVWERGAGLTMACGTGACAAAVAAIALGRAKSPVAVRLPGGTLRILWEGPREPVLMEGPAVLVFRGEYLG